MARKPRFSLPGIPQHVIQRGNNRVFFSGQRGIVANISEYCSLTQVIARLRPRGTARVCGPHPGPSPAGRGDSKKICGNLRNLRIIVLLGFASLNPTCLGKL